MVEPNSEMERRMGRQGEQGPNIRFVKAMILAGLGLKTLVFGISVLLLVTLGRAEGIGSIRQESIYFQSAAAIFFFLFTFLVEGAYYWRKKQQIQVDLRLLHKLSFLASLSDGLVLSILLFLFASRH